MRNTPAALTTKSTTAHHRQNLLAESDLGHAEWDVIRYRAHRLLSDRPPHAAAVHLHEVLELEWEQVQPELRALHRDHRHALLPPRPASARGARSRGASASKIMDNEI
jgi:hypothetical protein